MLFGCWTGSLCSKYFCSKCACCVCLLFWFGEIPRPVKFVCYCTQQNFCIFPPKSLLSYMFWTSLECCFSACCPCFSHDDVTARVHTQGSPLPDGVYVTWALLWMPCSVALSPAKQRFLTRSTLETDRRQNLQRSFQTKLICELIVCVGL